MPPSGLPGCVPQAEHFSREPYSKYLYCPSLFGQDGLILAIAETREAVRGLGKCVVVFRRLFEKLRIQRKIN